MKHDTDIIESGPSRRSVIMRRTRRAAVGLTAVTAGVLLSAGAAGAQEAEGVTLEGVNDTLTNTIQTTNLLWIILGACLVIFMQAGFAMVETGFCRAKHAAHVVATNFAIFGIGFVAFYAVGYSFMFGGWSYALPGFDFGYSEALGEPLIQVGDHVLLWWSGVGLSNLPADALGKGAVMGFFLYMVAFMDTTATIPTGSMAERWKFKSFAIWGVFCGAIYYPLYGAWTWGGGWLSQLGNSQGFANGYVDFAGSGIVHGMGGAAALAGAIVLGPRIGKYGKDGKPRALPAHNLPLAFMGTFILLFGWFGFNAASTFASSDPQFAVVAANTAIAGAFGAVVSMCWVWFRTGKPDPGMMANGMLAGLVAITAPCAFVGPNDSVLIGVIAGLLVVEAVFFIDQKLKIDDPVGAIAVHGINGTFGALAVGLFADGTYGAGWNLTTNNLDAEGVAKPVVGLFHGGGAEQLIAQGIAMLVLWTVMLGIVFAFFKIQDKLTSGGIRSSEEDEIVGLDMPEMGVMAYHDLTSGGGYGSSTGGGSKELVDA